MRCPHCGEESFAKKKNLTDGWKITGVIEVCALCGSQWQKDEPAAPVSAGKQAASRNRLAALLGGDLSEKVSLAGKADRRFCRNCRHFLVHPFKSVCGMTDLEADPMGECPEFEERSGD